MRMLDRVREKLATWLMPELEDIGFIMDDAFPSDMIRDTITEELDQHSFVDMSYFDDELEDHGERIREAMDEYQEGLNEEIESLTLKIQEFEKKLKDKLDNDIEV